MPLQTGRESTGFEDIPSMEKKRIHARLKLAQFLVFGALPNGVDEISTQMRDRYNSVVANGLDESFYAKRIKSSRQLFPRNDKLRSTFNLFGLKGGCQITESQRKKINRFTIEQKTRLAALYTAYALTQKPGLLNIDDILVFFQRAYNCIVCESPATLPN